MCALWLLGFGLGCSVSRTDVGVIDTSGTTGTGTPGTSGPVDGTGPDPTGTGSAGDSGSGPRLDVAGETGPRDDGGCAKVDFVFVVDNSASMFASQANLVASFPGFISTIRDELGLRDFHILAADSDGPSTGCLDYCETSIPTATCNGAPCTGIPMAGTCEATLGSGRRQGLDGSDCGVAGDQRFLDQTQPDLGDVFACIAQQGGGEPVETPIAAALAAVSPQANEAGGCNEGFLRHDAILVVTVITDEDELPSESVDAWYQGFVAAKGGDETAIVFLGILEMESCGRNGNSRSINELLQRFTNGSAGELCAADYAPFFSDAVSVIDTTCDGFEPPG